METMQALVKQMKDDVVARPVISSFFSKWHDMVVADMKILFEMTETAHQNKKLRDTLHTLGLTEKAIDGIAGVKATK